MKLRDPHLWIFDCDMTVIQCETIDELAAYVGAQTQVAEITQQAMEGKIDFEDALRQRVACLKDAPDSIFHTFCNNLCYTQGIHSLLSKLHKQGHITAIVSGGFMFAVEALQRELRVHHVKANTLEVVDGKLTGNLLGTIVDAAYKASYLQQLAQQYSIPLERTIAVGDGANDALMLQTAGFGVGVAPKAYLRPYADLCLETPDFQECEKYFEL